MQVSKLIISFCCISLLLQSKARAQFGISHEIGALIGPASVFTDYGERYNLQNNINNSGLGVGIVHFMNFAYSADCNCSTSRKFFNEHFKIRNELDYFTTKLEHFGPIAKKKSIGGQLLRAMHGKTQIIEVGTHLEYYPFNIKDYMNFAYRFAPYIALGIHYVNYNPDAYSDLGSIENPDNLFPTFRDGGLDLNSGSTFSVAANVGLRYKANPSGDILVETRWHYYNSDWVDGLNIDAPQNKANDWTFWINVGYVYNLNF